MVSAWFKRRLLRDTEGAKSVVDYGCGNGRHLALLKHVPMRTGIDLVLQEPFLDGDAMLFEQDMTSGERPWLMADVGMFVDTIEHLTKEDGLKMLDYAKEHHEKVIVFTPKGFWDNHRGEAAFPDNPHQKHLSGWEPEDLIDFDVELATVGAAPVSMYGVWTK